MKKIYLNWFMKHAMCNILVHTFTVMTVQNRGSTNLILIHFQTFLKTESLSRDGRFF